MARTWGRRTRARRTRSLERVDLGRGSAHAERGGARRGGQHGTAAGVPVTVANTIPAGPVPVAAYAFEEGSGATVADGTGKGHTGHDSRGDVVDGGSQWPGVAVRWGQRLGDGRRRGGSAAGERDDAGGVGEPVAYRWLADGDPEGAHGRPRLRAVRVRGQHAERLPDHRLRPGHRRRRRPTRGRISPRRTTARRSGSTSTGPRWRAPPARMG